MSTASLFKLRHFLPEIILLNVHWSCRYTFYQDLEEMMQERGVEVDHSTINRWILRYGRGEGAIAAKTGDRSISYTFDAAAIALNSLLENLLRIERWLCFTLPVEMKLQ